VAYCSTAVSYRCKSFITLTPAEESLPRAEKDLLNVVKIRAFTAFAIGKFVNYNKLTKNVHAFCMNAFNTAFQRAYTHTSLLNKESC
jgi:hypothetical protein